MTSVNAEHANHEDASTDEIDGGEAATSGYVRIDCQVEGIERAAERAKVAIDAGECVVLPTDTVYGIAADAFNADAVQRLLQAKGRGRDMPPPVLIGDSAVLPALAATVPPEAQQLVEAFWPGALTLILTAQPSLRMDLGDTEGTIAVRVPADGRSRAVLTKTGPLAVSSANVSGRSPARTIDEAIAQLGDSVSVYLDGGPSGARAASTIVDFTGSEPVIVRAGGISFEAIAEVVPNVQGPPADA